MRLDGEVGDADAVMATVLLDAEAVTDGVVSVGQSGSEAGASGSKRASLTEAVLHLDVEAGQLVIDLGAHEIHLELVLKLAILGHRDGAAHGGLALLLVQEHPLLLLLLGVQVVLKGEVHPTGDPNPSVLEGDRHLDTGDPGPVPQSALEIFEVNLFADNIKVDRSCHVGHWGGPHVDCVTWPR